MARKTKYTPETVKKIVEALTLGATYELAAGYAGIHYDTFNEWMKAKPEFSDQVKVAEGVAALGWLAKIEAAAAEGNWQAAAWKLERRYPAMYGRPTAPALDGNLGLTLRIEWTRDWRLGAGAVEQRLDHVEPDERARESATTMVDELPRLRIPEAPGLPGGNG